MKHIIFLAAALSLLLTSCGSERLPLQPDPSSGTSPEQNTSDSIIPDSASSRLQDLEYLCTTLEQKHKNLYFKVSKENFLAEKEKIAASAPFLSDNDFYYEMKRLIALIGDAHTNINFSDSQHGHLRPLPFAIRKIDRDWYIDMIVKSSEQYLGCQLLAINDVPIQEIYDRAAYIISYENEAMLEKKFASTITFIDALKYLEVADHLDSVRLSLKHMDTGETESVEMPSYNGKAIFNEEIIPFQNAAVPTAQTDDIYRSMALGQSTYFIQYNACKESPDLPMPVFVERVQSDLMGAPYKKVIVDLRYNSGGNSAVLKPLIDMLRERKNADSIQVYTLIGNHTNSSAILNAVELQKATDCIFVGTPTGGNVNHYGELQSFQLPNFPATVYYSTKYFELVPGYSKDSLYPDIPVTTTYEDILAGTDKEVQTVLAL